MGAVSHFIRSSIGKKFIMAGSGVVLVLFVLGHMLGNMLAFLGPEAINVYAHGLQSMPFGLLWVVRAFLLLCVVAHVTTGLALYKLNKRSRPIDYIKNDSEHATFAARSMALSGSLVLFFIIGHILHYTVRIFTDYEGVLTPYSLESGEQVFDVHSMIVLGFSNTFVSIAYIICMILLCAHLSHGVASMFQSVGLRNNAWAGRLKTISKAYGVIMAIGFCSVPLGVLLGFIQLRDGALQTQQEISAEVTPANSEVKTTKPGS